MRRTIFCAAYLFGTVFFTAVATVFYFRVDHWFPAALFGVVALGCMILLLVNRFEEIDEIMQECSKKNDALRESCDRRENNYRDLYIQTDQQRIHLNKEMLSEYERLASGLAVLVEQVYRRRDPDNTFLRTIRLDMLKLVMRALEKGVPAAALTSFVSLDAIRDFVQSDIDNHRINISTGPQWQRDLGQFMLEGRKVAPSNPTATSS